MFEDITGMSVLLLPVGACDDGAHSQNEKFDRSNYMNGIKVCVCVNKSKFCLLCMLIVHFLCVLSPQKVLGTYIYEIAALEGPKPSSCRCEPDPSVMLLPGGFAKGFRCKCEI